MTNTFAFFIASLFVLMLAPRAEAQHAPTVVIVVRHAEKAAVEGNDPPLSEAGAKRAQKLVAVAEEARVEAVYTTQYRRTRETAAPVAARLNAPVHPLEVTRENASAHPAQVAREILSKHKGRTVMVVGHSNTTPLIAEALSGRRVPPLDDATDFDTLYVIIIPDTGPPRLVRAKY
jgi:broad specificity phosphatase PhoE